MARICVVCDTEFFKQHGRAKTCSEECSAEHHRRQCRAREYRKYHDDVPLAREKKREYSKRVRTIRREMQLIARGKHGQKTPKTKPPGTSGDTNAPDQSDH